MSPQYGELRPTNGWDRLAGLGHPIILQRVSHLGNVTARHFISGRQSNFAALNRGRHLYSAGRPSRWALAHNSSWDYFALQFISVCVLLLCYSTVPGDWLGTGRTSQKWPICVKWDISQYEVLYVRHKMLNGRLFISTTPLYAVFTGLVHPLTLLLKWQWNTNKPADWSSPCNHSKLCQSFQGTLNTTVTHLHCASEKTVQISFCQNCVKFPPI